MNYRHAFHAGNFADVVKHIALLFCIDYLQKKDGGLCILDAHSGAGRYNLMSDEAARTGEWEDGIGRLIAERGLAPELQLYLSAVKADVASGTYPGSPLLIARCLRPQDRLVANELHPATCDALVETLHPYARASVRRMDAYQFIRATIPPPERRGLVLIDPPFEQKDEFATLARQTREWMKRWETGVYLIWYPIKRHLAVDLLRNAIRDMARPETWLAEAYVRPHTEEGVLTGCGLALVNAPYTVPEQMAAALQALTPILGFVETRVVRTSSL
jgi:23S rRNA (adenine2030-N6)-methyltransferase